MEIPMCVWCELAPAMKDDVLCASCKRDEQEAYERIYHDDTVKFNTSSMPLNLVLDDDDLPF